MRFIAALPLVALATTAFVVPDVEVFEQLAIETDEQPPSSWWERLPSKDDVVSSFQDTVDALSRGCHHATGSIERDALKDLESFFGEEEVIVDVSDDEKPEPPRRPGRPRRPSRPRRPRRPRRPHRPRHGSGSNQTIYQLISESKYTTKFAKIVDEFDDIVKLLNSTETNYTLYVPVDSALKEPPEDKKPSKKFIKSALLYHVGLGLHPAGGPLSTHTVPTALDEALLGGHPQRLRTSFRRVNLYSHVVAANIHAKNGLIHAVNHPLLPPPVIGRELSLFPSAFSTLLLAYEKTDFAKFIHDQTLNGSTVFAPTNGAFAKLGPLANAFLFNTEEGLKHLRALLKYQIVANETLYSDAYYGDTDVDLPSSGKFHIDLPTLLDDTSIGVDVVRFKFGGLTKMWVNGKVPVVLPNAVAKNGVIQVVGRVPIPPRKKDKTGEADGEIEVEDLKQRLADYIEDEDDHGQAPIDEL